MHLKREQIATLALQVTRNLKEKGGALFKVPEERVKGKIEEVVTRNVEEELEIEREVKRLMEQYRNQMSSGEVDPQRVFMMIKKQVAKEKKFIL